MLPVAAPEILFRDYPFRMVFRSRFHSVILDQTRISRPDMIHHLYRATKAGHKGLADDVWLKWTSRGGGKKTFGFILNGVSELAGIWKGIFCFRKQHCWAKASRNSFTQIRRATFTLIDPVRERFIVSEGKAGATWIRKSPKTLLLGPFSSSKTLFVSFHSTDGQFHRNDALCRFSYVSHKTSCFLFCCNNNQVT